MNSKKKVNIQFNTENRTFNLEAWFISVLYNYFLGQADTSNAFNDSRTNIHIKKDMPEKILILDQGKERIRGIFYRYDIDQYLKLPIHVRKVELNKIAKEVLSELFSRLELGTNIIHTIHENIQANNYSFTLNFRKRKVKCRQFDAFVMLRPEIDKWSYYIRFIEHDGSQKDVLFFETGPGNIFMDRKFFHLVSSDMPDSVVLRDFYNEIEFHISKDGTTSINVTPKIHSYSQIEINLEMNRLGFSEERMLEIVQSDQYYI